MRRCSSRTPASNSSYVTFLLFHLFSEMSRTPYDLRIFAKRYMANFSIFRMYGLKFDAAGADPRRPTGSCSSSSSSSELSSLSSSSSSCTKLPSSSSSPV